MDLTQLKILCKLAKISAPFETFERKPLGAGREILHRSQGYYFLFDHFNGDYLMRTNLRKFCDENSRVGDIILFRSLIRCPISEEVAQFAKLVGKGDSYPEDIVTNIDQMKSKMTFETINLFPELGNYRISEEERNKRVKSVFKERIKMAEWLLDGTAKTDIKMPDNASIIILAKQLDNKRICLIKYKEAYLKKGYCMHSPEWKEGEGYYLKEFTPADPEYNYVCPGRIFYSRYKEIWFDDGLGFEFNRDEMDALLDHYQEFTFFDKEMLIEARNFLRLKNHRDKTEKKIGQIKDAESKKKFDLIHKGKSFVLNDIEISKNKISFKEMSLEEESGFMGYYNACRIWDLESIDLIDLFNGAIHSALDVDYNKINKNAKFKINGEVVEINGLKTKKVNGKVVRMGDIPELLLNCILSSDIPAIIERASKIPYEIQEALEKGKIVFKATVGRVDDFPIRLPDCMELCCDIKEEGDKIFVKFGKKWLEVKSRSNLIGINKEKEYYNSANSDILRFINSDILRFIKKVKLVFKDATEEDVFNMVSWGIRDHAKFLKQQAKEKMEKIKKSNEFLYKAIQLTGAEIVEVQSDEDDAEKESYKVKGISGNSYLVTSTLKCYLLRDDNPPKYLCLVDTERRNLSNEWELKDGIAQRLLMLSKDKLVAEEIYSRGDHMDHHWREI